ncbi:MAG: lectin like domain-containing protein [Candidatus Zixiibacteriota bacterium]
MNKRFPLLAFLVLVQVVFIGGLFITALADPPITFDLRDVGGQNYVTSVKSQTGGTCWTHGVMAAMEGNMMVTGAWTANGESGEPNLAEYHLDWWNGFNQHNNDDIDPPSGSGLVVHEGGDYRVASAYITRGDGAVRDIDGQSYSTAPLRSDPSYHYYYPRDIEWFVAGSTLININTIKQKVLEEGVIGTCLCYSSAYMSGYIHYQPPATTDEPNHAVAIVGWDDTLTTQAPFPGAWLIKNSWGAGWGYDGYFWISYYDKHCGQHPEMGAISFQDVEPVQYDRIYYHDYHGWRDTKTGVTEAFNAFTAVGSDVGQEVITTVSFFTAADYVVYTVEVYDRFEGGELLDLLSTKTGTIEYTGFHTIDLDTPVPMDEGNDFYLYLELSDGGHPYDRTSDVPVLLGAQYRTIVESSSNPGESYYRSGGDWVDFYFEGDSTNNFCIKALSVGQVAVNISMTVELPQYLYPGQPTTFAVEISDGYEQYLTGTAMLHYRFDGGDYLTTPLVEAKRGMFEATIPAAGCNDVPEYYLSAEGDGGTAVYSPLDAPATVYTAIVGWIESTVQDNFETDQGWTTEVIGATSGQWQRGVPVNDPAWDYDPEADGDGSGQCWLTQNEFGNTDVDNGSVRLTSPILDMSDGGNIGYDYYLYLTETGGGVDRLLVEANNAGGAGAWTEIARHDTDGGLYWHHHEITESELVAANVTPTSTMKIRFTANDATPASIVEAGIDGFTVFSLQCEGPFVCGDADGSSAVDIDDAVFLIEYIFAGGPTPEPLESGDTDCSGAIDIDDVVYLIAYIFAGGPSPCDPNGDEVPDC